MEWHLLVDQYMIKDWAETIAIYISHAVEVAAAVVIAIALLQVIFRFITTFFTQPPRFTNQAIRIQFGSAVAVALELLLGADVLSTAVAPTWNDIGKLAAIAILRTALNYFLEKELKDSKASGTYRASGLSPTVNDR